MKDRIHLSSPHLNYEAIDELHDAISSNFIAPVGPKLEAFEKTICDATQSGYACALNSATSSIHLALEILQTGSDDVVITQTHTHIGGVNPIVYCGATPVFIDSEPDTWNMCPGALEEAILDLRKQNKSIKAILPVHLYGMPAKMDEILALGVKYDIPVIEDAAESLGSTYKGKFTGALGLMGIYSFNGNKIITTSGGGALVSNEKKYIEEARFLATQAREPEVHYEHTRIGYNYRLSNNVLAGIGRGQMEVLDERIAQRRANFALYKKYFQEWNDKGFDIVFQEEAEGSFSNRWLTCILVDPKTNKGLDREIIRLAVEAENIESRPLWKPMHLQPIFKNTPYYGSNVAERLFEIGLCLPSGSNLTDDDFKRIFSALTKVFQKF